MGRRRDHYEVMQTLERIEQKLGLLFNQGVKMSAELDALTAQVQATEGVAQSAVALIAGLAQQIQAAKDDPAKIQALADDLKAKTQPLAAAIAANTPPAPPPNPAP